MLIGRRIKELRMERKLSQQELGDMLGVTKVSICGYENGTRTPSLEIFLELANIFDVSADYLLGREIAVVNEDDNRYVGAISKEDIELIQELKHYPNLYNKLIRDIKRYTYLVNKKMR